MDYASVLLILAMVQSFMAELKMSNRTKRSNEECSKVCENGGICIFNEQGEQVCECLLHFGGKHCRLAFNYCESGPCREGLGCESTFGSYTCKCPSSYMGITCNISKPKYMGTLEKPHFAFYPLSYVGRNLVFAFYAKQVGLMPRLLVDMDDGKRYSTHIFRRSGNLMELRNFRFPVIDEVAGDGYIYQFNHTYSVGRVFNISIMYTNWEELVFSAVYQIRVVYLADSCNLISSITNSARDPGNATKYLRKSHVILTSTTTTNCQFPEYRYEWSFYKTSENEPRITSDNSFGLDEITETNKSYIEFPHFSLPDGFYAVVLTVNLIYPEIVSNFSIYWLQIAKKPLRARLLGGDTIQANWNRLLVLNASESHNPNNPSLRQNILYSWSCSRTTFKAYKSYCHDRSNPEIWEGVIHRVPSRALENHITYDFEVVVRDAEDRTLEPSTAVQVVEVVDEDVPVVRIICLRNCKERPSPAEILHLRAECVYCEKSELRGYRWFVYQDKVLLNLVDENGDTLYEPYLPSNEILVYENVLEEGISYTFEFASELDNKPQRLASLIVVTGSPPTDGSCDIEPPEGSSLTTQFRINCHDFVGEEQPLLYEVYQFLSFDTTATGTLVGHNMYGEMDGLILSPGLPEIKYLTRVRVLITNSLGIYTQIYMNVTVLPPVQQEGFETPIEYLEYLSRGYQSPFAHVLYGGNFQGVTQRIIATMYSLMYFEAEHSTSILMQDLNIIREQIMRFLPQLPVLDGPSVRETLEALDALLEGKRLQELDVAIVLGVKTLDRVLRALYKEYYSGEKPSTLEMEDILIRLMSVSMKLLDSPVCKSIKNAFNRIIKDEEADVEFTKEFNEDYYMVVDYYNNITEKIVNEMLDIVTLYGKRRGVGERETVLKTLGCSLSYQINSSTYFNETILNFKNKVAINTSNAIPGEWNETHKILETQILVMNRNPFWWHSSLERVNCPVVKFRLKDYATGEELTSESVPMKIILECYLNREKNMLNASIEILPYRMLSDDDITVYKIEVLPGGRLVLQFEPLPNNYHIQVMASNKERPDLHNFWTRGKSIPAAEPGVEDPYSFLVEREDEGSDAYYVGFLPHTDTLRELLQLQGSEAQPQGLLNKPASARVVEKKPNVTLNFTVSFFSATCLLWNSTEREWHQDNCKILPRTDFKVAACEYTKWSYVSASYTPLQYVRSFYADSPVTISFVDNPVIIALLCAILFLFLALLVWAGWKDQQDKYKRMLIFLEDNNPDHRYSYLVVVCTGRRPHSGTTSNVAIKLEGENGDSSVHILASCRRHVLQTGDEDWFIVRVERPLGKVQRVHLWHDFSGASPSWYCEKIVVHDIHTDEVWYFAVDKWLAPGHGDGSASLCVSSAAPKDLLVRRRYFKGTALKQIDYGLHGWIGMFYRHPQSNFTRRQRVATTLAFITNTMFVLIWIYGVPCVDDPAGQLDEGGHFLFSWDDAFSGFIAAFIVMPLQLLLIIGFRWSNPVAKEMSGKEIKEKLKLNIKEERYHAESVPYVIDSPERGDHDASNEPYTLIDPWMFSKPSSQNSGPLGKLVSFLGYRRQREGGETRRSLSMRRNAMVQERLSAGESMLQHCEYHFVPQLQGVKLALARKPLPYWFRYITWCLCSATIAFSSYFVALHSLSYGWVVSMRWLVSFAAAILLSIFVIEPFKFFIFTLCRTVWSKTFSIQDRSRLALTVEDPEIYFHTCPVRSERCADMYKPLPKEAVKVLHKNYRTQQAVREGLADMSLFLLLIVVLFSIVAAFRDSMAFYNNVHLLKAYSGRSRFGKTSLNEVITLYDVIDYINTTIIPSAYEMYWYNGSIVKGRGWTEDYNSQLVGVVQLRQLRFPHGFCKQESDLNATSHCKEMEQSFFTGDVKSYSPGWTTPEGGSRRARTSRLPWQYTNWWSSFTFSIWGGFTHYSGGGYVALLGRTRENSYLVMNYLVRSGWFDQYTRAVFVEFNLFNPNRNILSSITILMEKGITDVFTVYPMVTSIKVRPQTSPTEVVMVTIFIALIFVLLYCLHSEGKKMAFHTPSCYFTSIWHIADFIIVICGIVTIIVYFQQKTFEHDMERKLMQGDANRFHSFALAVYTDDALMCLLAGMLAFVTAKLGFVIGRFCFGTFTVVLGLAVGAILTYLVIFSTLFGGLLGFGRALYGTSTFEFHDFCCSICSIVEIFTRNFSFEAINKSYLHLVTVFTCFGVVLVFARIMCVVIYVGALKRARHSIRMVKPHKRLRGFLKRYFSSFHAADLRNQPREQEDRSSNMQFPQETRLTKLEAMKHIVSAFLAKKLLLNVAVVEKKLCAMAALSVDYMEGSLVKKEHQPVPTGIGGVLNMRENENLACSLILTSTTMQALERRIMAIEDLI